MCGASSGDLDMLAGTKQRPVLECDFEETTRRP